MAAGDSRSSLERLVGSTLTPRQIEYRHPVISNGKVVQVICNWNAEQVPILRSKRYQLPEQLIELVEICCSPSATPIQMCDVSVNKSADTFCNAFEKFNVFLRHLAWQLQHTRSACILGPVDERYIAMMLWKCGDKRALGNAFRIVTNL